MLLLYEEVLLHDLGVNIVAKLGVGCGEVMPDTRNSLEDDRRVVVWGRRWWWMLPIMLRVSFSLRVKEL